MGQGGAALVVGPSGIGKSALVAHFVAEAERSTPRLVALSGRCHESESVPFKALDSVVDALARHLEGLSDAELFDDPAAPGRGANGVGIALAARAFPTLAPAAARIASGATDAMLPGDPQEQRVRTFDALRDLLARVAASRPLVVVVEDLHWADDDGLALLAHLLQPPHAPAARLCPDRAPAAAGSSLARTIGVELPVLELDGLGDGDATALVRALLGEDSDAGRTIVARAGGHPMLLEELARHALALGQPFGLGIDDAIWRRIEQQRAPARALDGCSPCGIGRAPAPATAAGILGAADENDARSHEDALRVANLVRTTFVVEAGARHEALEPAHDRVRETVRAHLGPDALAKWHGRIAEALEASGADDPEGLALHLAGAGLAARAAPYAAEAAARAERALAFERAASLWRLALAGGDVDAHRLTRLADALGQRRTP